MYRRAYRPSDVEKTNRRSGNRNSAEYKQCIDPNYVDHEGKTNLHLAVIHSSDDVTMIERNIKAGGDVNAADKHGRRGVHFAAERGYAKCLQVLIKYGAEIDVFNKDRHSPLILAARHGFPEAIKVLQHGGAYINLTNEKQETALHYACANGHVSCAQLLLQWRAKINVRDDEGTTCLAMACKCVQIEAVRCLISASAKLEEADSFGRTPLHWVALRGSADIARLLIDSGAQVDLFDNNGQSPFVVAIENNHSDVLGALIQAKCDRSTIDGLNGTALGLASLKGHCACVKVLLEANDDPDEIGYFGMTPLMSAAFESHLQIVETLLEYGADPNVAGRMGATALIKALIMVTPENEAKRHKIVAKLIRADADVNHRVTTAGYFTSCTNGRNCPLSFAISSGYPSLVRMLLLAGSHISCKDIKAWFMRDVIDQFYDTCDLLCPVKQWKIEPHPLKHLCRSTIRKHIADKSHIVQHIEQLPMAPVLRQYVDFIELEQAEVQKAKAATPGNSILGRNAQGAVNVINLPACGMRNIQGTFLHQSLQQTGFPSI